MFFWKAQLFRGFLDLFQIETLVLFIRVPNESIDQQPIPEWLHVKDLTHKHKKLEPPCTA